MGPGPAAHLALRAASGSTRNAGASLRPRASTGSKSVGRPRSGAQHGPSRASISANRARPAAMETIRSFGSRKASSSAVETSSSRSRSRKRKQRPPRLAPAAVHDAVIVDQAVETRRASGRRALVVAWAGARRGSLDGPSARNAGTTAELGERLVASFDGVLDKEEERINGRQDASPDRRDGERSRGSLGPAEATP